jgi:hypothetical protein
MNLSITGNCQARPLSQLFKQVGTIKKVNTFILHLSDEGSINEDKRILDQSDLIIAQKTNKNFKPDHLNSHWLKKNYKDKVLIWPNIFFMGQQPFIRYITSSSGRLKGPLDDYHDIRILLDWLKAKEIINKSINFMPTYVEDSCQLGLDSLKVKENGCDVIISDLVKKYYHKELLFYSFNHPSSFLLMRLFDRLLLKARGVFEDKVELKLQDISFKKEEPLATYIMPSNWPDHFANNSFRGLNLSTLSNKKFINYSLDELKHAFFKFYDMNLLDKVDLKTIRFTPSIENDNDIILCIKNIKN